MRVLFKAFDSKMASREKLFKHASEFASQIGPDRLITLSHSEDRDNIVITIWYWGEDEAKKIEPKAKSGTLAKIPANAAGAPGASVAPLVAGPPSATAPAEPAPTGPFVSDEDRRAAVAIEAERILEKTPVLPPEAPPS